MAPREPLRKEDEEAPDWFIDDDHGELPAGEPPWFIDDDAPLSSQGVPEGVDTAPARSGEFDALCDAYNACRACQARLARREK